MRCLLGVIALLFQTSPLFAQSLSEWVDIEGRLAGGYTNRIAGANAFLVGDVTLRFSPEFFGRFGAELGSFGRADALDTPHETYGAVTIDIGPSGRMSIGVPRPAYDGFAVSTLERAFPSLGIDRTNATRSAATHGAMFANWLPYGVGFTNKVDGLNYAVSVHHAANMGATVVSVGGESVFADWQISGAVELSWGRSTNVATKVQVKRTFGAGVAGFGYYAPGAFGGSDLLELFGEYQVFDRVSLSVVAQIATSGATDMTAGIAARYGFRDNAALSVGIATDAGSEPVFNAVLDWTF